MMDGPILLEGPDGSGKTTLAGVYQKQGYKYIHHSVYESPTAAFRGFADCLMNLTSKSKVIIDRLHMSEIIYGNILRDEHMNALSYRFLDDRMLAANFVLVWCNPSKETVFNNWASRPEEELVKKTEQLEKIWRYYQIAPYMTSLPVVEYNYENKRDKEDIYCNVKNLRRTFYKA